MNYHNKWQEAPERNKMQYIRGIDQYKNENPAAITVGKFDGLHLGHEVLINRIIEHQKQDQVDAVVLAFDMSPFYEKMNKDYKSLLTNQEKAERLDGRVDYFVDCPFDENISRIKAEDFIKDIFVGIFYAKYIVIGSDFRFGFNRLGDAEMLQRYSSVYGYEVEVMEKKKYEGREISSTFVKEEIGKGNVEMAEKLLGYAYKSAK